MKPRLILHVFDRASGGVPEAILDFISNSPEDFQHILYGPADATIRDRVSKVAVYVAAHPNPILRPFEIRKILNDLSCTTIHAHSSISGAIIRLAFSSKKITLIYSPHCFAFERTDISAGPKLIFKFVEKILSQNTSIIAACSIREMNLAENFAPRKVKVRFVPNVSRLKFSESKKVDISAPFTFISVGRLSEQKNPRAFAKFSLNIGKDLGGKFVWVGDGDHVYKDELLSHQVEITGWLAEADVVKRLQSSHVYVHVARWEGFPLAILDAFKVGLPIIVDPIPAYGELEPIQTIEYGVVEIQRDYENFIAMNREAWSKTLELNTIPSQRASLDLVWNGK